MTAAPRAAAPPPRATIHRLRVARVDRLTDDAVAITLDVPAELRDAFDFVQGQHVALALPGQADSIRRSYSICTPAGSGELRVAVKLIPGGVFSEHAHRRLRPGDELDVMTPLGRFSTPLDPAQAKDYAAVAAGSGIAPVLSIAATALEVEPASTFTLLYGNRTVASTMFLEELLDLKNLHPGRLALHLVFSREPPDVELHGGRIDAARLRLFLSTVLRGRDFDEWFLCGPLAMVEELRAALVDAGADPGSVHREVFHAGPPARTPPRGRAAGSSLVTILLDGRATSFELDAGGAPILDAALALRPDAPYACKAGMCGTCRARLVEGEVDLDGGYALEPDELEAGFVLACQSHPRTPRVTLDFGR
ncbi:MAG TPA: 2Fe-2S iron-sulfur cluster-binding protein [Gaiellaceae bacterium]|nr:2Fe-2S iron-sulfur cluster-binding protein [Gaiellaceae bacterium]